MKISLLSMLLVLAAFGCKNNPGSAETSKDQEEQNTKKINNEVQKYVDSTWNFALEYPSNFEVLEDELPANSSVVNVYSKKVDISKPLAIHEEPEIAYIALLPKGFGVDGPSGKQKSFNNWESVLDLSFNFNKNDSRVYLLENGEAWAYYLKFYQSPEKWDEYGGIFVHYQIENFNATCISTGGESKPMQECDPMGEDEVRFSGEINEKSKMQLDKIMSSLYFFRKNAEERKELSDLIKVEKPAVNTLINSPIQISGEARGTWFFEAEAPVRLVDKNYITLAETSIKAKGEWMTNDFVPFSTELSFGNFPEDEKGYLIFEKANASGKPELDRKFTLPVRFPSE
ncbi:Gmad2 immunoglobulin-like domain-containing protein [uncultured Salegentibacter sp.]|uniref:Gmad2 immunoglobulin-like domain-containing protein n=1 Tax=uncultured Salegentibacter sp. TaxID=259320 RepID=UPI0030DC2D9A